MVGNTLQKDQKKAQMVEIKANNETFNLTVDTVRNYLISGNKEKVTNQEIAMFMNLCRFSHLNPWVRERTARNVRHILAQRKAERKNRFCYTYGTVTFFGMILSILCMAIAPLNGTIGFCVFTALFGAFLYSNREVL